MANYKSVSKIPMRLGWLALTFGAFFLFYNVTIENPYFSFRTDIGFLLAKRTFVKDWVWMTAFYLHVSGCIFCLVIGPFQFVAYLRRKYVHWHRNLGKIYIASILFVGAPSGFYMALFANGGFWAQLGFGTLSFLWVISTYLAYFFIKEGKVNAHKIWMVRSYALTFSAVTLRTWIPILTQYYYIDHTTAVIITAWINWIPNVILAEILVKLFPKNF
jgi:uncharacterized membrane protein